jgi:hypothetical protein
VLLLVVWIAVAVVVLVVLGSVGYGLVGAMRRLRREVAVLDRDLRPVLDQVLAQVQTGTERVTATRPMPRSGGNGGSPA